MLELEDKCGLMPLGFCNIIRRVVEDSIVGGSVSMGTWSGKSWLRLGVVGLALCWKTGWVDIVGSCAGGDGGGRVIIGCHPFAALEQEGKEFGGWKYREIRLLLVISKAVNIEVCLSFSGDGLIYSCTCFVLVAVVVGFFWVGGGGGNGWLRVVGLEDVVAWKRVVGVIVLLLWLDAMVEVWGKRVVLWVNGCVRLLLSNLSIVL